MASGPRDLQNRGPKSCIAPIQALPLYGKRIQTMKKLICILASAALFAACEQKTDVTPSTSAVPEKKTDKAADKPVDPNTFSRKPTLTSEGKTQTTTTSSPTP